MGVTIDTLQTINSPTDDDSLLAYDQDVGQAKRITLSGLKNYFDLDLSSNSDFSSLSANVVTLDSAQTIAGSKVFSSSTSFNDGFSVLGGSVDFSLSSVNLGANVTFDQQVLSNLIASANYVTRDQDEQISGDFTFSSGFSVSGGTVTFPSTSDVSFGSSTLSELTDKSDFVDLSNPQDVVGHKTFKNGFTVELGNGSVIFPDKSNVTFGAQTLDSLFSDLSNLIDTSSFLTVDDLTPYALTSSLSIYVTQDQISSFINADYLITALSDYIDSSELQAAINNIDYSNFVTLDAVQTITGIKTFENGFVVDSSSSVSFPQASQVSFDGQTLDTLLSSGVDLSDYVLSADLATQLSDYVLSADLATQLSDYVLLDESNDTVRIEEVTSSSFTLNLSHKNKIIHFIPSSGDIQVSLDSSVGSWEGFQCKMIHVGDDNYNVSFDFQINEESNQALSSKFSLISLYYYNQQSYWVSYAGGAGTSASGSYSLQLLGDDPYEFECGSGDSDPGANIYDPDGNLYTDPNTGSDVVYSSDWDSNFSLGSHSVSYSWSDPNGNSVTVSRSVNVSDTEAPTIDSFSISSNSFGDSDILDLNNFGISFSCSENCDTYLSISFEVLDSNSNIVYPSSGSVTATYDVSMDSWSFDSSPATFSLSQGSYDLRITASDSTGNTSLESLQSFSITGSPYYLQASSNLVCRFFGWNSMGPASHGTQSNFEVSRDDTQAFSTSFDASSYTIQDRLDHGVGTGYGVLDPISGAELWLLGSSGNSFLTTEDGKDCIELGSSSSFYAPNIHVGNSDSAIQSLVSCLEGSNSRTICYWYRPNQHDALGSSQDQYSSIVSLSNGVGNDSAIGMTASGAPSMSLKYNAQVSSSANYYNWFSPGGAINNHARHNKNDSNLNSPRAHNSNIVGSSYSGWSFFGFVYDGSTLILEDDANALEDTTPAALKFFHGYDDGSGSTYFTTAGFGSDGTTNLEGGDWRKDSNQNYVGTLNTIIENFCIGKQVLNGSNSFSSHPSFSGYLHDFRIYDIALTSADLQNIFESNEDLVN